MPELLKGIVIGFSIAAPVGPVGMLCIRRSLTHGRLAGFVSGLGAAAADTIYGLVVALGLSAVTDTLVANRNWFQLGGGLFLVGFGVATLRSRPPTEETRLPPGAGLLPAFGLSLVITLLNPMTVLAFIGIFAGFGIHVSGGVWSAILLVLGVFLGSVAWWLLLSTAAGWFRSHLRDGGMRGLNVVFGIIISLFGVWELGELFLR